MMERVANVHEFESTLCFFADSTRCGIVALSVLYDPSTSISITDLKAFTEIWLIDARKLPAAPALDERWSAREAQGQSECRIHYIVNRAKLLDTTINCALQTIERAHIHSTNSYHLRTRPSRGNILRHLLRFLDVSPNDTCVRSEMDECAHLRAAYCACSACAKDDLVGFGG